MLYKLNACTAEERQRPGWARGCESCLANIRGEVTSKAQGHMDDIGASRYFATIASERDRATAASGRERPSLATASADAHFEAPSA